MTSSGKDYDRPMGAGRETARARRLAVLGLVVNLVLALGKLAAGIVGNAYALIADAVESLGDVVGSAIVWGGLKYGSRPPDEDHPYGHGKAEALAGLIVAGLLAAAAVGISIESVREIATPHHAPAWWTLVVLVVVIVVKTAMSRATGRAARESGSSASHADASHHIADAFTSAAAFIGISVALIGGEGWEPADDWAALLASGVILYGAVRMALPPLNELLDRRPGGVPERASAAAMTVEGVRRIEQAHARKAGTRYWIDMHVEVDPLMSVADAHVISGKVKGAVRAAMPEVLGVLVHIEPWTGEGVGEGEQPGREGV